MDITKQLTIYHLSYAHHDYKLSVYSVSEGWSGRLTDLESEWFWVVPDQEHEDDVLNQAVEMIESRYTPTQSEIPFIQA